MAATRRKAISTRAGEECRATPTGVIYARVSSKDQEREGFSIPAQLQLLRGYATNRGVVVAKEFVDVETTKQAGRTGFGEMLTFLRKDKACRILLVEKTDRPRSWPAGMDCITPGARTPSRPRPSTRLCATGSTAATSTSMARGTSRASCGRRFRTGSVAGSRLTAQGPSRVRLQ